MSGAKTLGGLWLPGQTPKQRLKSELDKGASQEITIVVGVDFDKQTVTTRKLVVEDGKIVRVTGG